ncbi:MAG: SDR family oxidoreductase [Lachnospiraceae bacterium]|nr:SDR family oxidoreductase [Lachnospiraceae bacterium]
MSRVSIITGGTSGIGKAIVNKIISESQDQDDRVFVIYGHNDELASRLVEELPDQSRGKIELIKANLSEYASIEKIKEHIRSAADHVDWLVLNTGIGSYKHFDEYTPELWDTIMRTNVGVPVFIVKELKDMISDNGSILFMGSHAGQATYSSSLAYSASKAAVMFAARSMVKLFDDRGIRINTVAPGFIETRWQDNRSEESYERINKKIALHRFGEPEEVASLCYEILTNGYLNGGVYDIHGGYDYF